MGRRQTQAPAEELVARAPVRRRRRRRPWWRSPRRRYRLAQQLRRVFFWLLVALGVYLGIALASLILVGPSLWRAAEEGRQGLVEASSAILRQDPVGARIELESTKRTFDDALDRLGSPRAWPLRILPVASTHVDAGRSLAQIGSLMSESALAVARTMERLPDAELRFENGRVDLELARLAAQALSVGVGAVPSIERSLEALPTSGLLPPMAAVRDEARALLPGIADGVRKAHAALEGMPSLLAEGERKRYLVAFSNLSELRGSGGLFGYVTELSSTDGDLDLEELSGRPTHLFPRPDEVGVEVPDWFSSETRRQAGIFQNINLTTDFPTVGSLALQTAEAAIGELDGVISTDPIGLSAVLALTGPVRISSWPNEISASNVAQVAMHDVYLRITNDDLRQDFFAELVRTSFDRLTSTTIRLTPELVGAFDAAVSGGHFRMYSKHAADQRTLEAVGLAGGVARTDGATDVLSFVSRNATGNKGDWFLDRQVAFRVQLDPVANSAEGRLDVRIRNSAPDSGLPDYVIGSGRAVTGLPRGTNRQALVAIRGSADWLHEFRVDGDLREPDRIFEDRLRAYRGAVDVPPRSFADFTMRSTALGAFREEDGEIVYRLHVLPQALATPDFASIWVEAAPGWTVRGVNRYDGPLTSDVILEVRLERTARGSVVETLVKRPWRYMRDLADRF